MCQHDCLDGSVEAWQHLVVKAGQKLEGLLLPQLFTIPNLKSFPYQDSGGQRQEPHGFGHVLSPLGSPVFLSHGGADTHTVWGAECETKESLHR